MKRFGSLSKIFSIVVISAITSCSAADLILNSCDNTANWTAINGASVGAATHGANPAIQVTLPANAGGGVPTVFASSNVPYVPTGSAQKYDGISFWVKGDGSTRWGNIALWYDTSNYYRVYAQFPVGERD